MTTPSHIAGYTAEQLQAVAQAAQALQTAAESNWTLARLTFENTRKGGGPFTLQEWSTLVQERAGRRFSTATAGRYSKMWAEHSTKVEKPDWTEAWQAQYPASTRNVPTVAEPSEALLGMTARSMAAFIAERHPASPRRVRLDYLSLLDRDEFVMAMRKHLAEFRSFGDAIEVMSEDSPTGERLTNLFIEALDEMGLESLLSGLDPEET